MPAIDRVKLRMKIGMHEFEAEGPRDLVMAQLDTWMRAAGLPTPAGPAQAAQTTPADAPGAVDGTLRALFRVDAEQRSIVLRVHVGGRRRNRDAALLLLYGLDTCFGAGDGADVPAARLRAALAASGYRPQRLDRVLAPYVRAGLVRKAGAHKHETYGLTASGARNAAAFAARLAPPPLPVATATDPARVTSHAATSSPDRDLSPP